MIETNGEAAVAGVLLRICQLAIDLPLHVLIKHDRTPMFLAECLGGGPLRVVELRRPLGPGPHLRVAAVKIFIERAVSGELLEKVALAGAEGFEISRPRGTGPPFAEKLDEQELEETQLQSAHALVIDKLSITQRFDLRANIRTMPQIACAARSREILDSLEIEVNVILVKDRVR